MKQIIKSPRAPKPAGPYSVGVKSGPFLFISGQIPLDPATNALVKGDLRAQTKRVLENIRLILEDNGLTVQDVVRTTIYLRDMNEFPTVNEVYKEYFTSDFPARATVEVSRLPKDADIEIDATAAV